MKTSNPRDLTLFGSSSLTRCAALSFVLCSAGLTACSGASDSPTEVAAGGALSTGGASSAGGTSVAAGGASSSGGSTVAAGGASVAAGGTGSSGGSTASGGGSNAFDAPITATIQVKAVPPGGEDTQCLQVKLPNDAKVTISKVENTLSIGSHHFIVSALSSATATEKALTPCKPFRGALSGTPLTITQTKHDIVETPTGVGYGLVAHQVMHLELHYINTSTETKDIEATTLLYPASNGSALTEASVILVGTADFSIPAQSAYTTGPRYLGLPAGLAGVNFYAVTGHTHRLGTNVQVWSSTGLGGTTTPIYSPTPFNWDSPEMVRLDPPVQIPSTGGFQLQCSWNNTTATTIKFGESALAEMCFFWGYYYPKKPVLNILLDGLQYVDPSLIFGL